LFFFFLLTSVQLPTTGKSTKALQHLNWGSSRRSARCTIDTSQHRQLGFHTAYRELSNGNCVEWNIHCQASRRAKFCGSRAPRGFPANTAITARRQGTAAITKILIVGLSQYRNAHRAMHSNGVQCEQLRDRETSPFQSSYRDGHEFHQGPSRNERQPCKQE